MAQDTELPRGEAPPALSSPYFPDRVHEFVWRNWNLVPPEKLGRIIGASGEEISALAESMRLPPPAPAPPEMLKRGYITLLRRNWHLLPYEQLLQLVEMTPAQLAFSLHEDDCLWVKLGRLKPECEPLRYRPPDEAARRRAAEIRRVVNETFGDELTAAAEARFAFVRELSSPPSKSEAPRAVSPTPLRLVYSYVAVYGDPLANPELDPYPDGFLARLARVGVNGVWMHAVLRDLAPGGPEFPELGNDSARRIENLRAVVERAARHGIGVYLYLNEPRAMPEEFFRNRPELAGVQEAELRALCTSQPAVRAWISVALSHVFTEVPGLAGVYCITGSENLTSCASHGSWRECPRCRDRTDDDIIAEVVSTIEQGVHRVRPDARVIVSDWGWKGHGDAREIIRRLPKSVMLMSVSEWAKPIERGGVRSEVGEYSISVVGPGPRASMHWDTAAEHGIKIAAEIQFNNTCEIASVPYLPVLDLVGEHLRNLAPRRLDGMLIGWTMGGHPSPNFELARRMGEPGAPDLPHALDALAGERYGPKGAAHGRRAWSKLSEAYREYPYHIRVIYTSPVQIGPANPLYATKTGYHATMWGIPYDDLETWRGPYPAPVLAAQFQKMAALWEEGVDELGAAVRETPADRLEEALADLRYARACGIIFRSVANQTRFVTARDALAGEDGTLSPERQRQLEAETRGILESEIRLARDLLTLTREDSRIGFEPSCQYFYLPLDLVEKVVNCRWLLQRLQQQTASG